MLYIIPFLLSFSLMAKVSATWLGVGTIILEDDHNTIIFDPAFTTPGIFSILGITEFRSDTTLVKKILNNYQLKKVDGVFVTHTHYDHVIDAPEVARLTGATLYGDGNLKRIAKAYGVNVSPLTNIQIGNFKISAFERHHSRIFQWLDFLPGEVPEDFSFSYYDYKVGKAWIYVVEHKDGNILIDDSPGEATGLPPINIQIVFQGIANRASEDEVLDGHVKTFHPRKFIPIHFDNFFRDFDMRKGTLLPFVKLPEFELAFKKKYSDIELHRPIMGEKIQLFP